MRAGDAPGRADQAELRTRTDLVARLHVGAAQVTVHRDHALAMVDEYRLAVEEEVAGVEHAAAGRVENRRPSRGGDIHPAVRAARLAVEEPPQPERARARTCDGHGEPQQRFLVRGVSRQRAVDASTFRGNALEVLRRRIDMTLV